MGNDITVVTNSKQYQLNKEDMLKVGKGALIASTGAVVDIVAGYVLQIDFGQYTPLIYMATPIIVNFVRKLLAGKQ